MIFTLIIIIIGIFILSTLLLYSVEKISNFFKIPEFIIGFFILGLGTSLPELFLGIFSSLNKVPKFSLGNVIGANIMNLTLVVSIPVLMLREVRIKSKYINFDLNIMFIYSILPLFLVIDGKLSRFDALILLSLFFFYLYLIKKQKRIFRKRVKDTNLKHLVISFILLPVSFSLIFILSQYAVQQAKLISQMLKLSRLFIGIFLFSLGTTLPELIINVTSAIKKHKELILGNIVGSVIINSTLVLGVVALINPISVKIASLIVPGLFLLAVSFLFITFLFSERKIDWHEALSLLLFYIFFIIVEVTLKEVI